MKKMAGAEMFAQMRLRSYRGSQSAGLNRPPSQSGKRGTTPQQVALPFERPGLNPHIAREPLLFSAVSCSFRNELCCQCAFNSSRFRFVSVRISVSCHERSGGFTDG